MAQNKNLAELSESGVSVWLDDLSRDRIRSGDLQSLVDEFSLAQGRTACHWFRGWAQALNGAPLEGHRLIREAFEENTRLGMRSGASEVLGYAAQALLLAGQHDAAQAQLSEALQVAEELAERVVLPQLWLLEAAIALAKSGASRAEGGD